MWEGGEIDFLLDGGGGESNVRAPLKRNANVKTSGDSCSQPQPALPFKVSSQSEEYRIRKSGDRPQLNKYDEMLMAQNAVHMIKDSNSVQLGTQYFWDKMLNFVLQCQGWVMIHIDPRKSALL
ncbi:hypothetical protein NPIL_371041 [Nephila pilipes]|uniref:Uncharacterized protein n=1 Tax=Nephila pilipes TaxID=299642 RepID=A0A8X6NIG4_NEPPI|nr:hypothetical protein NPIL_371041 [Nephila pilipes]